MPFEVYDIAQGKIMIAFSDKNLSVGTLHMNPKQELPKHNRPVLESLFQLKGKCVMKLVTHETSMQPGSKGQGLIGSVSSSPTGNSDLKDGVSTVVDEDNGIKEVVLNEGESIDISPEQYHFHSNPFDGESVTFWKASGDITEIIDNIRNSKRL